MYRGIANMALLTERYHLIVLAIKILLLRSNETFGTQHARSLGPHGPKLLRK